MLGLALGLATPRRPGAAPAIVAPIISDFSAPGAPDSMSMTVDVASAIYWMLDASAVRSAAEIIAGGGQSSGAQAVSAGSVDIDLDFSAVADGTWYLHVVADNGASSNVIGQEVTFSTPSAGITLIQTQTASSSTKGQVFTLPGVITVGSEADRLVVVLIHGCKEVGADPVSFNAVTLGGVAMVEQGNLFSGAHGAHLPHMAAFTLVGPTSGPKQLVVDMTQVDWALAVTVVEFSGVDQLAPVASTAIKTIASGSAVTLDFAPTADGAWIIGGTSFRGGDMDPFSVAGDATEISDGASGNSTSRDLSYAAAAAETATGGAKSMTFTATGSDVHIALGLELEPT